MARPLSMQQDGTTPAVSKAAGLTGAAAVPPVEANPAGRSFALTEGEYAGQLRHLGRAVHEHDGVWWVESGRFYVRPAFEFRMLAPRSAKPRWIRAPLGYSHPVPAGHPGRFSRDYMILEGEDLRQFSLDRLSGKKRNQVRKGWKNCTVQRIADLEPHLDAFRDMIVSQKTRLGEQDRSRVPLGHFLDAEGPWRTELRRDFGWPGREWWGAWVEGRLVAYLEALQIDTVRFIEKMRCHTDFLPSCASDAIYFAALESAAQDPSCHRVINSRPVHGSLDRYKEQFLFRRAAVPFYTSNWMLYRASRLWLGLRRRARRSSAG